MKKPTSDAVVRGASCNTKGPGFKSRVRHICQTICPKPHQWLSGSALKSCQTGSARFNSLSRLSIQLFGVFCCFLRNSRKYGLGFTGLYTGYQDYPHRGHGTHRRRSPVKQSALKSTTTTAIYEKIHCQIFFICTGTQKI